MVSTVTVRGQTAIPVEIRRRHNILSQTKLEWISDGRVISVIPIPKDPVKALRGRIKDVDLLGILLEERKKDQDRE